jgi:arginase
MDVALVQWPYHLGREQGGFAAGVQTLTEALSRGGDVVRARPDREAWTEVGACFAAVRGLAACVRSVVERDAFPLVLASNCHSSLGTVAGVGGRVGVVWLDAHADFNTPDSTVSGFFDGMSLAMLTGTGWRALDPGEVERLAASKVRRAAVEDLPDALDDLAARVDAVYVHVDLDVLDPSVGRANEYAVGGGLLVAELVEAIAAVHERFAIRAAALTAYDADGDPERAIPAAARDLRDAIVAAATAKAAVH